MHKIKKTVLIGRNLTDSSVYLDERQITECAGGWLSRLPPLDLSWKIEGDSVCRVIIICLSTRITQLSGLTNTKMFGFKIIINKAT